MSKMLRAVVEEVKTRFTKADLPHPIMEARILIGGLLGMSSTEVFSQGDHKVTAMELAMIENAIERRLKHEPVHRILGEREFYGMSLRISRHTLEPRPDTEILVDTMLPIMRQIVASKGTVTILDLGTGTGAIALALLKECPEAVALGTDISKDALTTARRNADELGFADRFKTKCSDWFQNIEGGFDIIVSNPPYIKGSIIPTLAPEVRDFDPLAALDGGPDGLDGYRAIANGIREALNIGGSIGVEIGFDQKDSVAELFASTGFALRQAVRDYGNNDRVLVFSSESSGN